MRQPFRVAFLGTPGAKSDRLLATLSPSIHPRVFQDGVAQGDRLVEFQPELVLVLPGAERFAGWPGGPPVHHLSTGDLEQPALALEPQFVTWSRQGCPSPVDQLMGRSPIMARVRGQLATMATTPLPLLFTGENGTGKDLAAAVAHALSPRADQAFVAVNCGAIPGSLAETEFFGCVRGAFTGAENRTGFCQQAMGGTLFLDEVGEMPLELQSKLLRVLENRELRRVGSPRVETTDFRLICATNRDLGAEVRAGRFREDLYYRINVLPLKMPSLRERKEDIQLLADHFLESEAAALGRTVRVGARAAAKMMGYDWPGNLRQLRNVVLRAAVLHRGTELGPEQIEWED